MAGAGRRRPAGQRLRGQAHARAGRARGGGSRRGQVGHRGGHRGRRAGRRRHRRPSARACTTASTSRRGRSCAGPRRWATAGASASRTPSSSPTAARRPPTPSSSAPRWRCERADDRSASSSAARRSTRRSASSPPWGRRQWSANDGGAALAAMGDRAEALGEAAVGVQARALHRELTPALAPLPPADERPQDLRQPPLGHLGAGVDRGALAALPLLRPVPTANAASPELAGRPRSHGVRSMLWSPSPYGSWRTVEARHPTAAGTMRSPPAMSAAPRTRAAVAGGGAASRDTPLAATVPSAAASARPWRCPAASAAAEGAVAMKSVPMARGRLGVGADVVHARAAPAQDLQLDAGILFFFFSMATRKAWRIGERSDAVGSRHSTWVSRRAGAASRLVALHTPPSTYSRSPIRTRAKTQGIAHEAVTASATLRAARRARRRPRRAPTSCRRSTPAGARRSARRALELVVQAPERAAGVGRARQHRRAHGHAPGAASAVATGGAATPPPSPSAPRCAACRGAGRRPRGPRTRRSGRRRGGAARRRRPGAPPRSRPRRCRRRPRRRACPRRPRPRCRPALRSSTPRR